MVVAEGRSVLATLRRVQQLVRRAPGRILVYFSVAVILSLLAALVIGPLTYSALSSTQGVATIAFGEERAAEFQRAIPLIFGSIASSSFYGVPYLSGMSGAVPFTMKLARLILTITVLSVPVVILAELFVVFPTACACAIYLSVVGKTAASETAQPEPTAFTRSAFCMQCGAELSPGNRFCPRCGAPRE